MDGKINLDEITSSLLAGNSLSCSEVAEILKQTIMQINEENKRRESYAFHVNSAKEDYLFNNDGIPRGMRETIDSLRSMYNDDDLKSLRLLAVAGFEKNPLLKYSTRQLKEELRRRKEKMSYHEQAELAKVCEQCHAENKMLYYFCCLIECGQHEFCRGCHNNGAGKECRRKADK